MRKSCFETIMFLKAFKIPFKGMLGKVFRKMLVFKFFVPFNVFIEQMKARA